MSDVFSFGNVCYLKVKWIPAGRPQIHSIINDLRRTEKWVLINLKHSKQQETILARLHDVFNGMTIWQLFHSRKKVEQSQGGHKSNQNLKGEIKLQKYSWKDGQCIQSKGLLQCLRFDFKVFYNELSSTSNFN